MDRNTRTDNRPERKRPDWERRALIGASIAAGLGAAYGIKKTFFKPGDRHPFHVTPRFNGTAPKPTVGVSVPVAHAPKPTPVKPPVVAPPVAPAASVPPAAPTPASAPRPASTKKKSTSKPEVEVTPKPKAKKPTPKSKAEVTPPTTPVNHAQVHREMKERLKGLDDAAKAASAQHAISKTAKSKAAYEAAVKAREDHVEATRSYYRTHVNPPSSQTPAYDASLRGKRKILQADLLRKIMYFDGVADPQILKARRARDLSVRRVLKVGF